MVGEKYGGESYFKLAKKGLLFFSGTKIREGHMIQQDL